MNRSTAGGSLARDEAPVPPPDQSRLTRALGLLWRAMKLEWYGYVSIWRFLTRRKGVPAGGHAFSYHGISMLPVAVFAVLSLIELVAVDLLVRRWPSVRITMLILGVWGLVYLFGLLFGMLTRPHVATTHRVELRQGPEVSLPIDWAHVDTVTRRPQSTNGEKAHRVTVNDDGRVAINLWAGGETNIEIDLLRPQTFRLPGRSVEARRVRFYVDDPAALMRTLRPILNSPSPSNHPSTGRSGTHA